MECLSVWIGLTLGNLLYWGLDGSLKSAVERTFFQGVALLLVWLRLRRRGRPC